MTDSLSPMMMQWHACKKSAAGALLFFRLGDFYEAFEEDALVLAKELDLTLTKRQETAMCGVPFHTSEAYIDKLLAKGYRVAVAEQIEDPKLTKGLVKREVVRIVTPGTLVTSSLLSDKTNNFLAAITELNTTLGLALLDLTTAEFRAMEFGSGKELLDELSGLRPAEILISEKWQKNHKQLVEEIRASYRVTVTVKEEWHFDHRICSDTLLKHFQVHNLDGFGLKGMLAAINAAGALLSYVQEELNLKVDHIKQIQRQVSSTYLAIDRATQRHLELTELLHGGQQGQTLLSFLDKTETPMGARLLKQWVTHPLLSVEEIIKRQEAVGAIVNFPSLLSTLPTALKEVRDLQRLIMRISTGYATPRDLLGLRFSLEAMPRVSELLKPLQARLIKEAEGEMVDLSFLAQKIKAAISETPPLKLSDGNIFKPGYHPELDALRTFQTEGHSWIANYQTTLREETQIKTLKIGYTKAFGYYIEVSRGQSSKMPENFQRRQTLVGAERFITPLLKEYEEKVLTTEDRLIQLEQELFHELRNAVACHAEEILRIAKAVAEVDCLLALARIAKEHGYVCPQIDESDLLDIREGRHPIIEASLLGETFIPNDTLLDSQNNRLALITGPNMAGKSTYIRQVALIVILAQIGSFVPAKSAHIGIVDKVFSRIGASDDLARGQSTFMVEMAETANILHNATSRSLVILDEIGRGTSTYDGISIAWAVAEYLLTEKGKQAKTLFATHYWELTELEKQIPGAKNFNVAVHESEKGIVFLRKILPGGTDKSYGIHVARLAGLPAAILKRAAEMLSKLEGVAAPMRPVKESAKSKKEQQLYLFAAASTEEVAIDAIISDLKHLNLDELTPVAAHRKLQQWKEKLL